MLEGFEVLSPVVGAPAMSVTDAGISFNKTAVEKLELAEFVKVLINRSANQIAIVPCSEEDDGSRSFLKKGRESKNGVRWNNYDLKSEISQLMNWDLKNSGKKIKGDYLKAENALLFDLNRASILQTRNRGGSNE